MATRKPKAIYRPLLAAAWQSAWERKTLWVFGALASLVTTGGVFEIAFRAFKRIETSRMFFENVLSGGVPGYDMAVQYIQVASRVEPWRLNLIGLFATLLALALLAAAVWAQGALVAGVSAKKELAWHEALKHGRDRFWSLLGIAIVAKVLTALAYLVTALPLVLFLAQGTLVNAVLYFVIFLLFFPTIIFLSIVNNLAVVSALRRKHGTLHAIHDALDLLRSHWLATLELAVALFVASVALTFIGIILATIISAVMVAFLVGSLLFGSGALYASAVSLTILVIASYIALMHGLITTFQFAAWVNFYDKAAKRGIFALITRWWQGW